MEDNVSGAGQTITDYATLNHGITSDNNSSGMDCTTVGKVGNYSCTFDRTDDYISLANLNVDTQAGGKNTVAFWMYWDGVFGKMPFGWTSYDL